MKVNNEHDKLNDLELENFNLNIYNCLPKYKIFLHYKEKKYNCCFNRYSINNKLYKNLIRCGINIRPYYDKNQKFNDWYNDNPYPDINTIYIRLTKNKYYSDTIYPQKKAELEREILLILTGLLGGHKITCTSSISQNELYSIKQSLKLNGVDESIQFKTLDNINNNIKREEIYENSGADILIESKNRDLKTGWVYMLERLLEVFNTIEKTSIISYNYFIQNPDLYTFVFKRYLLNLKKYVYKIEEDRTLEKSIQARIILNKYGLGSELDSKYTTSKTHEYIIEFHDLDELEDYTDIHKMEVKYRTDRENDVFARLRREYEFNNKIMKKYWPKWGGDEKPIYLQFVKYCKEVGAYDKLMEWHKEGKSISKPCHWFKSKIDVDIWLNDNLGMNIELS